MQKKIVLILVLLFWAMMFSPVMAEEGDSIKPYGNLYVFFGYNQSTSYTDAKKKEIDKDTMYTINDNSNIGFNFSYSKYSGVFELGISDYENDREVKVRKAFGTYSFSFGSLMIGQAWNPYVRWSHEAANYYRSEGFGALYEDPTTQLKLTMGFGLYVDIIKPYVATDTYNYEQEVEIPTSSSSGTNKEYKMIEIEREITTGQPLDNIQSLYPKLAIGYDFTSKYIDAGAGAAWNGYKIRKTEEIMYNKDWIMSYLFYLYSQARVRDFEFNLNAGYAINPSNFGISVQSQGSDLYHAGAAASVRNIATGKYEIKDTWNFQGYAELGWSAGSDIVIYAGYGFSIVDYPMTNTKKDYAMEYYINAKFNIGNLIALTPAVSYRDYLKDMSGDKEGNDIYGGVLATVSFY